MRFRGLFTGSGPTLQEWLQDFTGNHVSGDSVCTGHIESHQSATAVEHRSTTQVGLKDRVVLDGLIEVVSSAAQRAVELVRGKLKKNVIRTFVGGLRSPGAISHSMV